MHTILESNYTFIKLPRNGNSKVKNNLQKTIQFTEDIKLN